MKHIYLYIYILSLVVKFISLNTFAVEILIPIHKVDESKLILNWTQGMGPYAIQRKYSINEGLWKTIQVTSEFSSIIPIREGKKAFYRLLDLNGNYLSEIINYTVNPNQITRDQLGLFVYKLNDTMNEPSDYFLQLEEINGLNYVNKWLKSTDFSLYLDPGNYRFRVAMLQDQLSRDDGVIDFLVNEHIVNDKEGWIYFSISNDIPSGIVTYQQLENNTLIIDWKNMGEHKAFQLQIWQNSQKLHDVWVYDHKFSFQLPTGTYDIYLELPGENFVHNEISLSKIENSRFQLHPIKVVTRYDEPQSGVSFRKDLFNTGQYQTFSVKDLCKIIGGKYEVNGTSHIISWKNKSIEWIEGESTIFSNQSSLNIIMLPLKPYFINEELFFPIRILAESLGLNTRYNTENETVTIFCLNDSMKSISLELDEIISGSNLNFSYFMAVHESLDHYYVVYDHSHSIIRFDKKNFTYEKLTAKNEYGFLYEFIVNGNDEVYAATSLGFILRWTGSEFSLVIGNGRNELNTIGSKTDFTTIKLGPIDKLVQYENKLYFHDWRLQKLYMADLSAKTVTLLANADIVGSLKDLDIYRGHPLLIQHHNKITLINPYNYTSIKSKCFERLFGEMNNRILSMRYLQSKNRWIIINSDTRQILEVEMPFDDECCSCRIIRSTNLAENTVFLNGLGTIDDRIPSSKNRTLVIDSDGFGFVNYTHGGDYEVITKEILGKHSNINFIGPMSVVEHKGGLFILSNLTHRIHRYDLSKKELTPYLGTGYVERNNNENINRLDVSIGYPSNMIFKEDELWVNDHYSRRLIKTTGDLVFNSVDQIHWEHMGGIIGFDFDNKSNIYIADHTSGGIYLFNDGMKPSTQPKWFAGYINPHWSTNSEVVRRKEAIKSTHDMNSFETVVFGLPQSIKTINDGKILVSDLYRHGIWLLDTTDKSVSIAAGLNSRTDYHFGSFTGNVGLEAKELRMGSPLMLTYDKQRKLIIIGLGYSRAIVFIKDDFSKTCIAIPDLDLEFVNYATFLKDGRLAIVDTVKNSVYIFQPPDLTPLMTGTDSDP
jgi:hypothetical protein